MYINNNEPILTSTLTAGIVQDTFAGVGVGGEEETTGGYFYCRFLALEFLSQTLTCACISEMDVCIHTYK